MTHRFFLSHRALLRALLDAGDPVLASDLVNLVRISRGSLIPAMGVVRAAVAPYGARIRTQGSSETLRYGLDGGDRSALLAMAAVPDGRAWFRGFSDNHAVILRMIVEADGQPVALTDIVSAAYAHPYPYLLGHVASIIEKIRDKLAKQGHDKTILRRGRPDALTYAWGLDTGDADKILPAKDGITLPSVGGAYHFLAGRLTLDGQPAGRAA